ncbi:MAG: transposase, partial [Cetobacterium sp.]
MRRNMTEEFYQGELGYTKYNYRNKESNNSRNGYSSKKLKSSAGEIEVNVPRDRNGEYEPQVVKKYQNTIGQDLEAKIISMYAKGMTTSDIESHIEEIYGYQVSDSFI